MKRCVTPHHVTSFGEIPVGSLWADDSPFLTDENAGYFVHVEETPAEEPKPQPVRKFGKKAAAKKAAAEKGDD